MCVHPRPGNCCGTRLQHADCYQGPRTGLCSSGSLAELSSSQEQHGTLYQAACRPTHPHKLLNTSQRRAAGLRGDCSQACISSAKLGRARQASSPSSPSEGRPEAPGTAATAVLGPPQQLALKVDVQACPARHAMSLVQPATRVQDSLKATTCKTSWAAKLFSKLRADQHA